MTHTYNIEGMTCSSCQAKVKSALLKLPDVLNADVSLNPGKAVIEMQAHIPLTTLKSSVASVGNYAISESGSHANEMAATAETKSWFATYKPLLLIGGYIVLIASLTSFNDGELDVMNWMNHFMAGFFMVFSFFKMLDLRGFADSYSTYDLLAQRWRTYGFIYPFLELALGIAFVAEWSPFVTNLATVITMGFSSLGVIQSLMAKRTIQCACLGTVFKLPMSTITLVEDVLMVVMGAAMLVMMET
ncbi:MAG: cation transporter [Flavobacteriales bacterium]|nr:cation transporter [Flavobacteriales bacterium]